MKNTLDVGDGINNLEYGSDEDQTSLLSFKQNEPQQNKDNQRYKSYLKKLE